MISVAMTSYNGEKYIEEQIESILNQTVKIDEIIIVDDGSIDGTVDLIKKYDVTLVQNEKNIGYKENFKKAMSLCHGDIIFLCDQDDIWLNDKVEIMSNILMNNANIQVLSSSFTYIDVQDNLISIVLKKGFSNNNLYSEKVQKDALVEVLPETYLVGSYFQGCSFAMKKEIRDFVISHFYTRIPHDWLIGVYASLNHGMYFLNKSLFQYRIHENNTLGVTTINQNAIEHINRSKTLEERTALAKSILNVLDIIKLNCLWFYEDNEDYCNCFESFLSKHVSYLENKNIFRLLFQNVSPYYKQIKSYKARIMDLLYCLK